ncbi:helix-turn-helix domain-containing protein [Solirubrobacter ginsenosidimutans]|uniref:Helix-turn-helix domain-containing protein n=1 Tax=Solirubrobacter ginsenosidimutans TaxID=490573 RepID=A0A9X3N907_9ACTN|nr:helix-turn-helix domain-containing protein [Solirubrobacter ginsenosidimutans]MDA0167078.1 helix-turn-helix domain-containing protein [Solirubrobacter ginsenosidimutans]
MPDALARLLAHPLRHRLLLEYSLGPRNPAQVARTLGEPLNLVSYHTGILSRHGYVELVGSERRRGALARFYRTTVATIIESDEWAGLTDELRRALATGTLEQATGEARRAAIDGGFDAAQAHLSRSPLELDEQGRAAVAACLREALADLEAIVAASRERDHDGERQPYEVVMLAFAPAGAEPGSG